ncbi:MAG: class I SAM-dependent methyltransferase [Candidatus Eremiobacterota bacterium]
MFDIEEKLARSLTAESTNLIPYLPYLLQDLWELGSMATEISDIITGHINISEKTSILDLACGKGAVSIHLAKSFGCNVKGIDFMQDFIDCGKQKSRELLIDDICTFEIDDINETVKKERNYDIVILGAAGDVLGLPDETITKLKYTIKSDGYIIIDDAFVPVDSKIEYYTKDDWIKFFKKNDVKLIEEKIFDKEELAKINQYNQEKITNRANELSCMYPEKAELFEGYVKSQQDECNILEEGMIAVTWLLQKNNSSS